jgi:hypothetical protein
LRDNTDLNKYGFTEIGDPTRMEFVIADLMKAGKVTVDEYPFRRPGDHGLNEKFDPSTILMVSQMQGPDEMVRWFCTPTGKELLSVTYIIVN